MSLLVRGELVTGLSAYLPSRDGQDYALGSALSYLLLPGLRGFWTMGSYSSDEKAHDMSGQSRPLSSTGSPVLGYATTLGLAPCLALDGQKRLYRVDEGGLAITGAMTCGLWFKLTTLPVADMHLLSKWVAAGNQRSWSLYVDTTAGYITADVTTDGSTVVSIANDAPTFTDDWYFAVMRFTPSTELALFVYDTKWTNVTGIPATIYDSTADFEVGSIENGGTLDLDGKVSLAFLCAYAVSDTEIGYLYQNSRALFGITSDA